MKKTLIFFAVVLLLIVSACGNNGEKEYTQDITSYKSPIGTDVFKPDSASIAQNYQIPDWFKDAKLGIFIHWGVYAVPAYGSEWYPRKMYLKDSKIHDHHVKTYGSLTEFGYKDFIPMFKAE